MKNKLIPLVFAGVLLAGGRVEAGELERVLERNLEQDQTRIYLVQSNQDIDRLIREIDEYINRIEGRIKEERRKHKIVDEAIQHNNKGFSLVSKRPDEALREYKKALELDPDCLPVYSNLAELFYDYRYLDRAEKMIRKSLEFHDECESTGNCKAIESYASKGKNPERAVCYNDDCPALYFTLSKIDALRGNFDDAIEHCEKAVKLSRKLKSPRINSWDYGIYSSAIKRYQFKKSGGVIKEDEKMEEIRKKQDADGISRIEKVLREEE
ncbi:MAG: tetratricopeptide repeat protein [archaeon]